MIKKADTEKASLQKFQKLLSIGASFSACFSEACGQANTSGSTQVFLHEAGKARCIRNRNRCKLQCKLVLVEIV
jgi:hypothetical protein